MPAPKAELIEDEAATEEGVPTTLSIRTRSTSLAMQTLPTTTDKSQADLKVPTALHHDKALTALASCPLPSSEEDEVAAVLLTTSTACPFPTAPPVYPPFRLSLAPTSILCLPCLPCLTRRSLPTGIIW